MKFYNTKSGLNIPLISLAYPSLRRIASTPADFMCIVWGQKVSTASFIKGVINPDLVLIIFRAIVLKDLI